MLSFDTNVLVYAVDKSGGEKHALAIQLIEAGEQLDTGLTEQVLIEFLDVATNKARQPLRESMRLVRSWLAAFPLITPGASVVSDTLRLLSSHKLSVWDARLLSVCAAGGCDVFLSEDLQDNALYGGVHVLNPFNPVNAPLIQELLQ